MSAYIPETVLTLSFLVVIVLFAGTPDIADALIHRIAPGMMCESAP